MSTRDSHQSSPHKVNLQGYHQFAGTTLDAAGRQEKLVLEMVGHYVGPVPIAEFLNILPKPADPVPNFDCSNVPDGPGKEKAMYEPLNAAIEQSQCCPSLVFRDTSGIKDRLTDLKPDGTLLPLDFLDIEKLKFERNYMYAAEVIFELKATTSHSAFHDEDKNTNGDPSKALLEASTRQGMLTRGQLIDYATQAMSVQHRTFIFTVCIAGHQARIIRWDRSGAIVSASFNYTKTQSLADFLWRYNHATRAERGFDENVCLAALAEAAVFTDEVEKYVKTFTNENHRTAMEDTLEAEYPTYKISVTDSKTKKALLYLVRRPFFDALSPSGRATRGYIAWSIGENKLRFLKDTWRTDVPNVLSEADAYDLLSKLKIPHLPEVCSSGDVEHNDDLQRTLTDEYAERDFSWKRSTIWIRPHIHHRLIQKLALPLDMVQSSFQLTKAILNVLIVIEWAFREKKLLHRDISAGNVMLNDMLEGILNDWDHVVQLPLTGSCHVYRTGTWQYISVALLQEPGKLHSISDDVESCFWLLLNFAWRYFGCKHVKLVPSLFDEIKVEENRDGRMQSCGGLEKEKFITTRCFAQLECQSPPLKRVICAFGDLLFNVKYLQPGRYISPIHEEEYQKALEKVEKVDSVIKILKDAIASDDWPTQNDARPDCLHKRTVLQQQQHMLRGYHTTFSATSNGHISVPLHSPLPPVGRRTNARSEPATDSGLGVSLTSSPPFFLPRSSQAPATGSFRLPRPTNSVSLQVSMGSKRVNPDDAAEDCPPTEGSNARPGRVVPRKKAKGEDIGVNKAKGKAPEGALSR